MRLYGRACGGYALNLRRGFGEKRFVFQPFPLLAEFFINYLIFLEEAGNEGFRHYIIRAVRLYFNVRFVGIHTERHVGRQRPRRSRPRKYIAVFVALYLEARDHRIFLYGFIALRDLVRGERRAATRAIGHDFVTLVQESLLVHFLQCPPFRLDILVVVGDVGIVHIHPVAEAVAHLLPQALRADRAYPSPPFLKRACPSSFGNGELCPS